MYDWQRSLVTSMLFSKAFDEIKSEYEKYDKDPFSEVRSEIETRPIVVYGAGTFCTGVIRTCVSTGFTPMCICDSYKRGSYTYDNTSFDIISPETLCKKHSDALVIISTLRNSHEIKEKLKHMGFPEKQIGNIRTKVLMPPDEFLTKHYEGYEWAYNFFSDALSKQLVLDKIRLLLYGKLLSPNSDSDMYYEKGFISLSENELFIDAGAFNGDTIEQFFVKSNNKGNAVAFEPNKSNCEKIASKFAGTKNVSVVNKGLWSCNDSLVFDAYEHASQGASFIRGSGDIVVPVTTLDDYVDTSAEKLRPSFIKMDIEGAEKEALIGCENVIKNYKPKLAICAYHKPEDIYTLPRQVIQYRDDYKLVLRQHFYCHCDHVLYGA